MGVYPEACARAASVYVHVYALQSLLNPQHKADLYYTARVSIGKRDEGNQIGSILMKSGYLDSLL